MGDKLILYDWRCNTASCNTKYEALAPSEQRTGICPECGGQSKRLISTPRIALDGCDPAFPSAYDKWAKTREQKAKKDREEKAKDGL